MAADAARPTLADQQDMTQTTAVSVQGPSPAAPQALHSSFTTSAGAAIRSSRQARWPVSALAAGIDAASMARQCPSQI